jgi:hypothetical protein
MQFALTYNEDAEASNDDELDSFQSNPFYYREANSALSNLNNLS